MLASVRTAALGTILLLVTVPAGVLSPHLFVASHHASTLADDPLFGSGCRYVVVDTGTSLQPNAAVCRPY